MTTFAGPWLSPAVVIRNSCPKLLPGISCSTRRFAPDPNGRQGREARSSRAAYRSTSPCSREASWGFGQRRRSPSRLVSDKICSVTRLLLVGGGHTHVQVLRHIAMNWRAARRHQDVAVTVVLDQPVAVYSGMVPGFVAGQYRAEDLEIDVLPLARRAGASVVLRAATGIDTARSEVHVDGRPPLRYDLASFDIGSTVAGLELPGVREHTVPTRPIARFIDRVDEMLQRRPLPAHVVVVGAGAGGVELAFCLDQRLRELSEQRPQISVVHAGSTVLDGYSRGLVTRVERNAQRRNIALRFGRRAVAASEGELELDDGTRFSDAWVVWVTGAVAHPVLASSGLPVDSRGFVSTGRDLRVVGTENVFAVGDCATMVDHPGTPKAGVYAVRQGPPLIANLEASLEGRPLRAYRPQADFLALLNLGDGSALGAKWGRSFEGPWVMRLKDRIDRKFMRRFQVLDQQAALQNDFEPMAGMDEMLCGGCAAKVGQSGLERALARLPAAREDSRVTLGADDGDDAAAWLTAAGDEVVVSVDAFRAFTEDPYLVGQVASVNALSDLWAKGVRPRGALALVTVPESQEPEEQEEVLYQTMAGVRSVLDDGGVTLLGGHSTTGPELCVGLSVSGEAGAPLLRIDALRPGDAVVCTHAYGTGVLLHADGQGRLSGRWLESTHRSMLQDLAAAASVARRHRIACATDVTGFGVAGHLGEMVRRSQVSAKLDLLSVPSLPGALELLEQGLRSTAHEQNAEARKALALPNVSEDRRLRARIDLLFDPQTCGGLLMAVPAERAESLVADLRAASYPAAAVIAHAAEPTGGDVWFEVLLEAGGS